MNFAKKILVIFRMINDNIKIKSNTSILLILIYFFRGFTKEKIKIYKLNSSNYKLYLNDFQRRLTSKINSIYAPILDNKLLFESVMKNYFNIPKNYFLVIQGRIYSLIENNEMISEHDLMEFLETKRKLVLKPIVGGKGIGVKIISLNDNVLKINNNVAKKEELTNSIKKLDNYLICEFIEQNEYSKSLFEDTTNTIRMLLYRSPETNEIRLIGATQRIGGKHSKGLDNFSAGGAIADIDLETGEIGDVLSVDNKWNIKTTIEHPDTNSRIKGIVIPNWLDIKNDIVVNLNNIPYLKYVGLDIVITNNWYYVIEGNNFPEPRIIQVFKPLLADDDVLKFFKHYNIVN